MMTAGFPIHASSLKYDVAIVGGAASGSAIAWFLASNPDFKGKVLVVEQDPTLALSAAKASNNCMRQQFASEINVKIAQYAAEFFKDFRSNLGPTHTDIPEIPEIPIRSFGYLYLADTPEFARSLEEDQKLQAACGAGTQILTVQEITEMYPFYSLDDITCGSLNTKDEGAFDAFGMVQALRWSAQKHGVEYIRNKVIGFARDGDRIRSISLETGEVIQVGVLVDTAGTRAAEISGLAGVELPIEARRRYTYIFSVDEPLPQDLPLTMESICGRTGKMIT